MLKNIFVLLAIILTALGGYYLYTEVLNPKPTVYWLNFKPESEATLKELAKTYQSKNDVKVKIVTPESGQYSTKLNAELQKRSPPTLFVIGNKEAVKKHEDYLYDLKDSKIAGELNTQDFILNDDNGRLVGIGYCYEFFGIIVNEELLEQSGHTLSEITNFDSLKTVAEDIHKNANTLGFDAFTSSSLDSSSSWRFTGHLSNLPLFYESRDDNWTDTPATIKGTYLDNYKNLWDLYIQNSASSPYTKDSIVSKVLNAQEEFGNKKAVFYQNGNWEYDALVNTYHLDNAKLKMIPFYGGVSGEENAGFNSGTENYWAINAKASKENIDATLDFLYWLVTDEDATKKIGSTFGSMPFKKSVAPVGSFYEQETANVKAGKYAMTWAFNYTPNHEAWREAILKDLITYSGESTDANWDNFKKTFVDKWKELYEALNG